jgi:hypothetical protein
LRPGDTLEISVRAGNDFPDLAGGVFNVTYDADVLAYRGAQFSNPLWKFTNGQAEQGLGASGTTTIQNISFAALLDSTGGGAADLTTLRFVALAVGASDIALGEGLTGFTDAAGGRISVTYPTALEAVVTPLPAGLPLLLAALLGLVGWRSRRQR